MEKLTKPSAPRFSLSGRTAQHEAWSQKVPGPGTYTLSCGVGELSPIMASSRKPSFGRSERRDKAVSETAGPGAYEIPAQLGPQLVTRPSSTAVGFSGRIDRPTKPADIQGPGVCRTDSFLKPHSSPNKPWAPQFTFGAKVKPGKVDATPGPGACLVDTSTQADPRKSRPPAFTLSGRHSLNHDVATNVGPGRCRTDSSMGTQKVSTQKNSPAFSFGRRFQESKGKPMPGPGAYG